MFLGTGLISYLESRGLFLFACFVCYFVVACLFVFKAMLTPSLGLCQSHAPIPHVPATASASLL